jgi:hypothetical protein
MMYLLNQDEYDQYVALKEWQAEVLGGSLMTPVTIEVPINQEIKIRDNEIIFERDRPDIKLPIECPTHHRLQSGVYRAGEFEYVCLLCEEDVK